MEKIKINLTNGTNIEKPLITAFRGNNGIYIVLDNEMNGTMGLPIILVSKLENNKLIKITDQNEWNAVKENLRMIIAGNQVDYVKVENILMGDEVFFTQLTLPVASFEALKNNYKPQDNNDSNSAMPAAETTNIDVASVSPEIVNPTSIAPNIDVTPVSPEVAKPTPIVPNVDVTPVNPEVANPTSVVPNVDVASVNPEVANPTPIVPNVDVTPTNPEVTTPTPVTVTPEVSPVMPEAPQNSQVEAPVMDQQMVSPVAEPTSEEVPVDFTADKEAFLKACENMFDALVAKFNK